MEEELHKIYKAMFDPANKKHLASYALCDSMISNEMEWLLYYLWHKESGKPVIKYNFKIPDTVIYKIGRPFWWYFTSKEGMILKKTHAKLTHECVYDTFTKKLSNEVVATAYKISDNKTTSKITMEYLHAKEFKDFIHYNDENLYLDILQRFVVWKGKFNELIRCDWTPTINIVEKKSNPNLFKSAAGSIYKKIVTYEGPSHLSKSESVVSNMILNDINVAWKFIADQLTSHGVALKHANFYFKIDDNDELVLIFANNFKLEPFVRISWASKSITMTIPEEEREKLLSRKEDESHPHSEKPQMDDKIKLGSSTQMSCPICNSIMEKQGAYEFTIKYLLSIYNFYQSNNCGQNVDDMKNGDENVPIYHIFNKQPINRDLVDEEGAILKESTNEETPKVPEIIKCLFKGMDLETFEKKSQDFMWMYKNVFLWDCWYGFIKDVSEYKNWRKIKISKDTKFDLGELDKQLEYLDGVMEGLEDGRTSYKVIYKTML
jgi:hypothetical protein